MRALLTCSYSLSVPLPIGQLPFSLWLSACGYLCLDIDHNWESQASVPQGLNTGDKWTREATNYWYYCNTKCHAYPLPHLLTNGFPYLSLRWMLTWYLNSRQNHLKRSVIISNLPINTHGSPLRSTQSLSERGVTTTYFSGKSQLIIEAQFQDILGHGEPSTLSKNMH